MKDANMKLLLEMMGQCKRSDRELAKALHVSQPTVTRARRWLEQNGYINEYTLIPNFAKIGLELAAFTLIRLRTGSSAEKYEEAKKGIKAFVGKSPNAVMSLRGEGMGCDAILVSLHKDFAEFTHFMRKLKMEATGTEVVGSFLASLKDPNQYRSLTFKHIKEYINRKEQE